MRKQLATLSALAVGFSGTFALGAAPVGADSDPSIVGLAVSASGGGAFDDDHSDFDILVNGVVATGLADLLDGKRQLTVFAPTDQAFLDLTGAETEAGAFAAVVDLLGVDGTRDVISYHVAPGERDSSEVVPATRIRTLTKQFITKDAGSAVLNDGQGRDINILAVDLEASNGVVHVIDSVMLP